MLGRHSLIGKHKKMVFVQFSLSKPKNLFSLSFLNSRKLEQYTCKNIGARARRLRGGPRRRRRGARRRGDARALRRDAGGAGPHCGGPRLVRVSKIGNLQNLI